MAFLITGNLKSGEVKACFALVQVQMELNYIKNGEKEVLNISPIETDDNSLEAFIDEVLGKKSSFLSGDEVFNSSEATLLIQKKADSAF